MEKYNVLLGLFLLNKGSRFHNFFFSKNRHIFLIFFKTKRYSKNLLKKSEKKHYASKGESTLTMHRKNLFVSKAKNWIKNKSKTMLLKRYLFGNILTYVLLWRSVPKKCKCFYESFSQLEEAYGFFCTHF